MVRLPILLTPRSSCCAARRSMRATAAASVYEAISPGSATSAPALNARASWSPGQRRQGSPARSGQHRRSRPPEDRAAAQACSVRPRRPPAGPPARYRKQARRVLPPPCVKDGPCVPQLRARGRDHPTRCDHCRLAAHRPCPKSNGQSGRIPSCAASAGATCRSEIDGSRRRVASVGEGRWRPMWRVPGWPLKPTGSPRSRSFLLHS